MKNRTIVVVATVHAITVSGAHSQNAPPETRAIEALIERNTRGIQDNSKFIQNIQPSVQELTDTAINQAGKPAIPNVPRVGPNSAKEIRKEVIGMAVDAALDASTPRARTTGLGEMERRLLEDAEYLSSQNHVDPADPFSNKKAADLIQQRNCEFNPSTCTVEVQGRNAEDVSPFPRLGVHSSLPACASPPPMACNPIGTPISLVVSNPQRTYTNECSALGQPIDRTHGTGSSVDLVDCVSDGRTTTVRVRSRTPLNATAKTIVPVERSGSIIKYSGFFFANYCMPCRMPEDFHVNQQPMQR